MPFGLNAYRKYGTAPPFNNTYNSLENTTYNFITFTYLYIYPYTVLLPFRVPITWLKLKAWTLILIKFYFKKAHIFILS